MAHMKRLGPARRFLRGMVALYLFLSGWLPYLWHINPDRVRSSWELASWGPWAAQDWIGAGLIVFAWAVMFGFGMFASGRWIDER
jgi:hypothetical protein